MQAIKVKNLEWDMQPMIWMLNKISQFFLCICSSFLTVPGISNLINLILSAFGRWGVTIWLSSYQAWRKFSFSHLTWAEPMAQAWTFLHSCYHESPKGANCITFPFVVRALAQLDSAWLVLGLPKKLKIWAGLLLSWQWNRIVTAPILSWGWEKLM